MPTKTKIPQTADELAEILNDDDRRQEIFSDPDTTKEFLGAYAKVMNTNGDLGQQISDNIKAGLVEFMQDNGYAQTPAPGKGGGQTTDAVPPAAAMLMQQGVQVGAIRNAAHNPKLSTAKLDGLYSGMGALAQDIHRHRNGLKLSDPEAFEQVRNITNAYSEVDPATGGFLVPEEMRSNLLSLALEQSIVRSRATVITMGSLTTSIPYVDATTHVGSVFGGMIFYWVGESSTITRTEAKFGRVRLEANKLVGGAAVPNELWADAPAMATWLEAAAPMGIAFYEDAAGIDGDGVGKPLGVLNSPAKIEVTRAATDEIRTADVYGMYSRMLPQSLSSAVWLVNQSTLPQLFDLQSVVQNVAGTENVGGSAVNIVDITASPRMTLLGRPLIVTEKVPALGTSGDIAFVDWQYYLLGDRQAVSLDYSEHSRFMNDETELRIIERVDGRPWVQSALTPLNGPTVSPIVTLNTDTA